jgi:hypothetical protein
MTAQHAERPYIESLPKTLSREVEPNRFDDYVPPDYFWPVLNWAFGVLFILLSLCALKELYIAYNQVLAFTWIATIVAAYAGIALVHKRILGK